MKGVSIAHIPNANLRRLAEQLDQRAEVGNKDGTLTTAEVEKALAATRTDAAATAGAAFGDEKALLSLKTFLTHFGSEGGTASGAAAVSAGTMSPLAARAGNLSGHIDTNQPPLLLEPRTVDSVTTYAEVPYAQRDVKAGQSVLMPLEEGQLHIVELRYHDTRKLRDLEFNYREKGPGSSSGMGWKTFRGDQWFEMKKKEDAGQIEIKREPDHNGPWVNNPIRVKIEVLYPDGRIHDMGRKFVDFHVHDARSVDGPGSGETDNIYKQMPYGQLPPGCMMRFTPYFENKKPWEQDRTTAVNFQWVRPVMIPPHQEKVRVRSSYRYEKPPAEGYPVDPNRKIKAVMVNWTDNGGTSRGSVSVNGEHGRVQSQPYNVGSGETELIPVDAYAKDGKLFVQGAGVEVGNVDVLYAE